MAIRVDTIRALNYAAFIILGIDAVVLTYWIALLIWISISEPGSLGVLARSFHIGLPITLFLALSRMWELTTEDIRGRATVMRFRGTIIWLVLFTFILIPDIFIIVRMSLSKPFQDDRIRQASLALSIGLMVTNVLAWIWMVTAAVIIYITKRRILVQLPRQFPTEVSPNVFVFDDWRYGGHRRHARRRSKTIY